jgi:hypothetical protein
MFTAEDLRRATSSPQPEARDVLPILTSPCRRDHECAHFVTHLIVDIAAYLRKKQNPTAVLYPGPAKRLSSSTINCATAKPLPAAGMILPSPHTVRS